MVSFTFTASFSPGRTRLLEELLPSLPLLEELPLLSRATNGLTGGMRGDVGVLSITATEDWRIRLGFLPRGTRDGEFSTGEDSASAASEDRALEIGEGLAGRKRGVGSEGMISCERRGRRLGKENSLYLANWTSSTTSGSPAFFVLAGSLAGDEEWGTMGGVTVGVVVVCSEYGSDGLSVSFVVVPSSKRPRKEVGKRVGAGRIVGANEGMSSGLGNSTSSSSLSAFLSELRLMVSNSQSSSFSSVIFCRLKSVSRFLRVPRTNLTLSSPHSPSREAPQG